MELPDDIANGAPPVDADGAGSPDALAHFSEYPFALHFLLQGTERLVDIIVANEDLHGGSSP